MRKKLLKGLGFDPGRTDGYFSKETEQAVQAFQKANQLPVTGRIDETTADVLQTKIMEAVRDPKHDVQLKKRAWRVVSVVSEPRTIDAIYGNKKGCPDLSGTPFLLSSL